MRRDASLFTIDPGFWDRPATIAALAARDVGALFSLLRKYTGASQTGIGSRVGMAQSEISGISLGKRQVTEFDTYVRIADGFDMPDRARIRLGLAPARAVNCVLPRPRG